MIENGADFVLTFEAEANFSTDWTQLVLGVTGGGDVGELNAGGLIVSARKMPAPSVTNVVASSPNGYYKAGDVININVEFSKAVTVFSGGDTPTLALETGATDRVATLTGAPGANILTFSYTVQEGGSSADLDFLNTTALSLNGSYILDSSDANVNAVLTLPTPAASKSLSNNANIVIDNTDPVVSDCNITVSGATGAGGVFKIGDQVTVTWDPVGGDGDTGLSDSLGTVTVDFSQFGGGTAVAASYEGGAWVARYTIASGESLSGTNLNASLTATDAAANATTVADTTGSSADSVPPDAPIVSGLAAGGSNTGAQTDAITYNSTPTIEGTADANSTVEIFVGGTKVGDALVDASGNWRFAFNIEDLTEGDNSITTTVDDPTGNTSDPSTAFVITLDTLPATVTITSDVSALKAGETGRIIFSFSEGVDGFDNDDLDIVGGTLSAVTVDPNDPTKYTATFTPSQDFEGDLSVTVKADSYTDIAGNLSAAGSTPEVAIDSLLPSMVISGPTDVVVAPFTITITFSEIVQNFGVDAILIGAGTGVLSDFVEVEPGKVWTALITPVLGQKVTVNIAAGVAQDIAGNDNAAAQEYSIMAGSPEYEFNKSHDDILQMLINVAEQSLRGNLATNQRMVQGARARFMASQAERKICRNGSSKKEQAETIKDCERDAKTNAPLNVDGSFALSGTTLSTAGSFFGLTTGSDPRVSRLMFGDFDLQVNGETGSSTATLTGRVAWERNVSDKTMLGIFMSGDFAQSSLEGAFSGDQTKLGVGAGGYGVHSLSDTLSLDGFVNFGIGRNNLNVANDALTLSSNYQSLTVSMGTSLSGIYDYQSYEFRPELALSYGKTWIGNVGFTGSAYGLVDETLGLDAGTVSILNLTLRPEFVWALDAATVKASTSQLSLAPRFICQNVTATDSAHDCGAGAEIGLTSLTEDAMGKHEIPADHGPSRRPRKHKLCIEPAAKVLGW